MRVSVVGIGYVGLVTAAGIARFGHDVVCIDTDKEKVDAVNRAVPPICEMGLDGLLADCVLRTGKLRASGDYEAVIGTDLTMICVGTPSNSDGSIDVSHVRKAARGIGEAMRPKSRYHVVVTRSTVVPGTTRDLIVPLLEKHSGKTVGRGLGVAYNPEFLQEGKAVPAFFKPDRIIIGEVDTPAGDMLAELYRDITAPIFRTDVTTAEMTKYASNAFLATKISFINEMANICQRLGVDVYEVVRGLSFDYRIGDKFLSAGAGFGGSCLPKDVKALVYASAVKLGYPPRLLRAVLDVNEAQVLKLIQTTEEKLGDVDGKIISVLGLAFKPETDDVREAPAIKIITALVEKGASVRAYDPQAMDNARKILPREVEYCGSASEAIDGCDCILILTEWEQFRDETLYEGKRVIDGRRVLDPRRAKEICDYQGVCW